MMPSLAADPSEPSQGEATKRRGWAASSPLPPLPSRHFGEYGQEEGPEPLRTPAQVSRGGYFRLATLLRLAQLVPDIRLDSPGARLPHYLGGGLLAILSPAPASPGGFVQLAAHVALPPTGLLH